MNGKNVLIFFKCSKIFPPTFLREEREEVAGGLPQLVVGECRLLIVGEQDAVEGGDLRLPDGVRHAPQCRQHVHHYQQKIGYSFTITRLARARYFLSYNIFGLVQKLHACSLTLNCMRMLCYS